MMESQDLEKAKLIALEAEAAKNTAEKIKLEKETIEIEKRLQATFLGISFSSYLKTIMAGLVAGALIWTITVDYPGKILSAHKNIKEINKIRDETEQELEKVQNEKDLLEKEKLELEKETQDVEIKKKELEEKNLQLKEANLLLEKKNKDLRRGYNELQTKQVSRIEEKSEIEKDEETKKVIAQVHDIENQQSDLPGFKILKQEVSAVDTGIKTGWLYLGEYSEGKWVNKHFDFSKTQDPDKLNGEALLLTSQSINVRKKMLTGDIIKILKKGEKVKILEVKNYPFTDYIWAKIQL